MTRTQSYVLEDPIRRSIASQEALYPRPPHAMSPAEIKALFGAVAAPPLPPRPDGVAVEDAFIALDHPARAVAVRHYRPAGDPALAPDAHAIYLHGGGFTLGGLDSHDATCAALAAETKIPVTAVDYRKLPDHPFPAAYDDAVGVLDVVARNGRGIVLAGDSSGANLALAAALTARERNIRMSALLLYYPIIGVDFETASYVRNADAPALTAQRCRRVWADYLGAQAADVYARKDSRAVPLFATDYSGLPPTVIVTAEYDPLASDGAILAERIRAAGGDAALITGANLPHGFLKWRAVSPKADAAIAAATAAVKNSLEQGHACR